MNQRTARIATAVAIAAAIIFPSISLLAAGPDNFHSEPPARTFTR